MTITSMSGLDQYFTMLDAGRILLRRKPTCGSQSRATLGFAGDPAQGPHTPGADDAEVGRGEDAVGGAGAGPAKRSIKPLVDRAGAFY